MGLLTRWRDLLHGRRPPMEPDRALGEDTPAMVWTRCAMTRLVRDRLPRLRVLDRDGWAEAEPPLDTPACPPARFIQVRNRLAVMTGSVAPWQRSGSRTGSVMVVLEGHAATIDLTLAGPGELLLDLRPGSLTPSPASP
ncbi:MAG: hypothetical protein RLZZ127_3347 [Planctomycetota bacterium]|jgi:hypothetical protein